MSASTIAPARSGFAMPKKPSTMGFKNPSNVVLLRVSGVSVCVSVCVWVGGNADVCRTW